MDADTLKLEGLKAAADNMHVLITLSSGFIGGMVAFRQNLRVDDHASRTMIRAAFACFGLTIVFAVVCLAGVTGNFSHVSSPEKLGSIDDTFLKWPATVAVLSFFFGMAAFAYIGIKSLGNAPQGGKQQ